MSMLNQAIDKKMKQNLFWRHISKTIKTSSGGNYMMKCSLCDFDFNGSYIRVRAHLLIIKGEGLEFVQR